MNGLQKAVVHGVTKFAWRLDYISNDPSCDEDDLFLL